MRLFWNRMLAGLVVFCAASAARADEARPVTLAVGTSTLNIGYPNVTLPLTLGYWKEEGLDVSVLTTPGSLQGIQQLVGGGAQFAEGNATAFLQGISQTKLPLRLTVSYGIVDWQFVVPKDSPISGASDLAGKKVGAVSLASGGTALLKAYLAKGGVDPADVEIVPVGFSATAIDALRTGQVDALLFWGSAVASFENAGLEMRTFADPDWRTWPDYGLGTTADFAASHPEVVVGMARGMAKAVLFARTNPDCALAMHRKAYPETVAKGPDEATSAAWDLNVLTAKIDGFEAAEALSPGPWGDVADAHWLALQQFLVDAGQISAPVAPAAIKVDIPDFYGKVNDFDHEAVTAEAKACSLN